MKVRLREDGPTWKGAFRGKIGGMQTKVFAGEEFEGADAQALHRDYPEDFVIIDGYANRMIEPAANMTREAIGALVLSLKKAGEGWNDIVRSLAKRGIKAPRGGGWHATSVKRLHEEAEKSAATEEAEKPEA